MWVRMIVLTVAIITLVVLTLACVGYDIFPARTCSGAAGMK